LTRISFYDAQHTPGVTDSVAINGGKGEGRRFISFSPFVSEKEEKYSPGEIGEESGHPTADHDRLLFDTYCRKLVTIFIQAKNV